ncbi:MAG: recombinase RecB [Desulfurococcaceae archaeon]|nr:recombinase RecB [Desulfurococcaceae archaeon]
MSSTQTPISARRRWLSSERIAQEVLGAIGFRVLETRKKVVLNGIEVGEIDALATDDKGDLYAVEVKAGRIDVTGIRQAYVNALLLNAKPMVVCKGFADDAAKELAEKLGVQVIQLSDIFLVESEELNIIVREVIEETLTEYLELFYSFNPNIKPEHMEILQAIYESSTIDEAAEKLGVDVSTFMKKVEDLKKIGIISKWAKKYSTIKRIAQLIIQKQNLVSALDESRKLVETAKTLYDQLKQFQNLLTTLNQQLQKIVNYISKLESRLEKQENIEIQSQ